MFKRLFVIYAGLALSAYGQGKIAGKVFCRNTGAGIMDVQIMAQGTGVLTDSVGCFLLELDTTHVPVKLEVRHIQYEPISIQIHTFNRDVSIPLEQSVLEGDAVSVTANSPRELQSAVSCRVVHKKEIEYQIPTVVADVLTRQPGITSKNSYQAPLVLRGLSGQRVLILRNGNRRFSSYPAGFMSHTVNVYDLEKIELEKGPASVRYGAGAIAGIINLIDKSPFKQKGLNMRLTSTYASNNTEKSTLLCGGWSNGALAVKGAYRMRDAGSFHYANGEAARNSDFADNDLSLAIGWLHQSQTLQLNIESHEGGPWGKPVGFSGTDFLRVNTTREDNEQYSFSWQIETQGMMRQLACFAYYASEARNLDQLYLNAATHGPSYREVTFYTDTYYGCRIEPVLQFNESIVLRNGVEFYRFGLSSPMEITDYFEGYFFQNRVSKNARSSNWGAFSEMDIKVSPILSMRSGIRYDRSLLFEGEVYDLSQEKERQSDSDAISATVSAHMRTGMWSHVKLNLARAFRMPTPQEMFTNTYTSNGVLYGNPDLNPEFSWNADLVYLWEHPKFQLEASPFYWLLENMITKEMIAHMPGINYEYVNIGKARVWGGELSGRSHFENIFKASDQFQMEVGAAYTNGTDVSGDSPREYEPLDYIPPVHVTATVGYAISYSKRLSLDSQFQVDYHAYQNRYPEGAYVTPEYVLVSVMLGMRLKMRYGVSVVRLAVNNLLNVEYYAFQSFVQGKGRDVRVLFSFSV